MLPDPECHSPLMPPDPGCVIHHSCHLIQGVIRHSCCLTQCVIHHSCCLIHDVIHHHSCCLIQSVIHHSCCLIQGSRVHIHCSFHLIQRLYIRWLFTLIQGVQFLDCSSAISACMIAWYSVLITVHPGVRRL